jgi:hypothetical protein
MSFPEAPDTPAGRACPPGRPRPAADRHAVHDARRASHRCTERTEKDATNAGGGSAVPRRDQDLDLLAGLLEHIACLLQSGCPQAARRALMLVDRIACLPDAGAAMRAHAEHLRDALEEQISPRANAQKASAGRAVIAAGHTTHPTHPTHGPLPC